MRIRIGVIVAEGRDGGKEPVHGLPFHSPEASAPGGGGERAKASEALTSAALKFGRY